MAVSGSVLLIGNFLSEHVGNRSVCEDLAGQLQTAGVDVFTTSRHRARIPRLLDIVSTIWRRRREYTLAHVDVYSGTAFCLAEAACWTLRAAGKPFVLTLRGGNLPGFADRWPTRVRRLLNSAAAAVAPSEYLRKRMESYHDNLQLLPNPIELGRYPFQLREAPGPRLVWLRSYHKIYNPALAAQVVALLEDQFPEIQLTMIGRDKGDGSLQTLQQVANELGVTDRITYVGGVPKNEVPSWLSRADVFLNTTNVDNLPVSALEAMACGLCVVSTDAGGMPYLVDDNQNGLLVPCDDAEAMAAGVRRVLDESGLAARLSANARQTAEGFDWAEILPQWRRLFDQVRESH